MLNETQSAASGQDNFTATESDGKAVFIISLFQNKKDNQPQLVRRSWQELCDKFRKPSIRADKDGSLFSPAFFDPALRRKENVKELSLLVLDIDHNAEIETIKRRLIALNSAYAIYSSHSHLRQTESNPNAEPRFRVVIPLLIPIASANYPALWQFVKHKTGLPLDEAAKDTSRIFYTPAIADKDAPFDYHVSDGAFLDWRELPLVAFAQTTNGTKSKVGKIKDSITEGERNKTLLSLAGTMQRRGMTRDAIFAALQTENEQRCNPPLDETEVAAIADSITHYPSEEKQTKETEVLNDWKMPELHDAALYGLAGQIVRTIEPHTEADLAALLVQLLAAFGAAINICAYFVAEADRHFTKIFAVLVGVSSNGRKGTSWGHIRKLMIRVDESFKDCIIDGLSSGEGLIYHVRDAQEKQVPVREKGQPTRYQKEIVDEGAKEKRAFVIEPEFARVLDAISRKENTLSSVIRQAWNSDTLRIMTKNPVKASNAQISIIGHITKTELAIKLNENETANGFANRFLWLFVRRSKYLPEGGALKESDLNFAVAGLQKALRFACTAGELKRDDEARDLWHKVYQRLADGHAGLFGAVTSRAVAQVMRLACIYALLDCSNIIRKEHLEAALALWQYSEDSARYIFGTATGDKLADKIYAALIEARENGLSRAELFDVCGHGTNAGALTHATRLLAECGKARMKYELTEGAKRQTERWFALRFFPEEIKEIKEFIKNSDAETDNPIETNSLNSLNSDFQETDKPANGKLFADSPKRVENSEQAEKPLYYTFPCWKCSATVSNEDSLCPNCEQDLNEPPF